MSDLDGLVKSVRQAAWGYPLGTRYHVACLTAASCLAAQIEASPEIVAGLVDETETMITREFGGTNA